jgi:pyochelin biosynthetic protein PchC
MIARTLVCLPHAGGSARFFTDWAELLPQFTIHAVQYPGREERLSEPCIEELHEMVDHVVPQLPRGPLVLFGHSMGASIAFEIARRIPVAHLFVSGRPGPARQIEMRTQVHLLDDDGIVAELEKYGETEGLDDLRDLILPTVRSDYTLLETYTPDLNARIAAPITAFVTDADPSMAPADADCWADATTGTFTRTTFSGDHFFLSAEPSEFTRHISATLDSKVDRKDRMATLTLEDLRRIIAEMLKCEPSSIGDDDNLFEAGLDSIRMMRLAAMLRKHGISAQFTDLAEEPTLTAWAVYLGEGASDAALPRT